MRKFIGNRNTLQIEKYDTDPEGNPIRHFNKRTMARKALQAFLKGETFYKYKGEQYVVPAQIDIEALKKEANG